MGRKCEISGFVRDLDEVSLAYRVAGRGSQRVDGWVRTVRRAVGVTVRELAGRLHVTQGVVFRLEDSERAGTIGLGKLRRLAEGLGCELVYGLVPKEGTLAGMAAAQEAGRAQKRAEAKARRLRRAKEKRFEAAEDAWEEQRAEREAAQRMGVWRAWRQAKGGMRSRPPEPPIMEPCGVETLRRAARKVLRKYGFRFR